MTLEQNRFPLCLGIALFLIFAVIGIGFLKYPKAIRKYDTRMVRYVKNEAEYVAVCYLFGIVFLVLSLVPLMLAIFQMISN
jgi:Ca2+/Na+ antiporter